MSSKDPLRTRICDMLGIEYPIVAFTHCKDVAAAVINAGGFAVLGESRRTPDGIADDCKWLRERIGDKPFGVDLLFPASVPEAGSLEKLRAEVPAEQRAFTEDIKKRYKIPEPKTTTDVISGWINKDTPRKQLEVVLDEKVPVIASGLGNPDFFVKAAHERGMQVWGLVGKQRQARKVLAGGVDVIVAVGMDAAGHTGNVGTFSLIPQVKAIAGNVPVIAGGGITTGRHLAGAIALGAEGVWTGTVWLPSRESDVDMRLKERLIAATSDDTSYSDCVSGFTMRTLKSKWHEEWARADAPKAAPPPYQLILFEEVKKAAFDWDLREFMTEAAGQGVGFVDKMKPVRQIISDMIDEAYDVFDEITGRDG